MILLFLTLETDQPLGLPSRTLCWPQVFKELIQTLSSHVLFPRCLGLQKYNKKHYAQAFFEKKIKKNQSFL